LEGLSFEWYDSQHKPTLIEASELKRGGQIYFLHNEMGERQLEHVMQYFYHRRFNILVCTTIIETGIDVPNADAQKRIDAIGSIEELGMGFTLATHDLEIRGAGELLDSEQNGHMQEVGYTLYASLLELVINFQIGM
jgi:transcription-repair coupling factor (superfamily II helicase)